MLVMMLLVVRIHAKVSTCNDGLHLQVEKCSLSDLILWNKVSKLFDFQQLVLTADRAQTTTSSVSAAWLRLVNKLGHGGTVSRRRGRSIILTEHSWDDFVIITILHVHANSVYHHSQNAS